MRRFALIGAGGYIAPRHLEAIKATGNVLVAALDKSDSVGVLDSYFPEADFFTEFERFDRHLEKLRRKGIGVEYVSICSPNYLHDAHVRSALRVGAHAICEKPLALNPWNVQALADLARETDRQVNTILQLRLHPALLSLRDRIQSAPANKIFDVDLTYITSRGHWYMASWKSDVAKSGGLATNIGVHFFDMLTWVFGRVRTNLVHVSDARHVAGVLELERARVRWFLSIDREHLPTRPEAGKPATYRSIKVDGEEVEFSEGFKDLHTLSYAEILKGRGFSPEEVLPSIQIVSDIRSATPVAPEDSCHPFLRKGAC